jgi:hypothetical protein
MALAIVKYAEEYAPGVVEFNRRLLAGGAPPDRVWSIPVWLPPGPDAPLHNQYYLALENGVVRGAYALKFQDFEFHGTRRPVVFYHHPLSEGIVDKRYAGIGVAMLLPVLRANPMLFALGIGGYDWNFARMLVTLKWAHCTIPYCFRVIRPARFLREIQGLRQSRVRRLGASLAAASGLGWAALKMFHGVAGFRGLRTPADVQEVAEFDRWADEVWKESARSFAMIAVRDACTLRALYPGSNSSFIRLRVSSGGRTMGWAVVSVSQQAAHPAYGNLRVGMILDGLAHPKDTRAVVAAATCALMERGVDVIVTNQSHASWIEGLKACGFVMGPSHYVFGASKALSALIHPFGEMVPHSHLNRGDGDYLMSYIPEPR